MKMRKLTALILILLALAMALCGCSSAPKETAAPESAAPAATIPEENSTADAETAGDAKEEKAEALPETQEKFTFWVYKTVDPTFLTDYNDNPALKYLLTKTYGPQNTRISFDFWTPPAGSANDNFSNMIGSGDYADIIDNVIGDSTLNSYQNGISLDITDYVKQYMPNYLALLEANPEFKERAITMIDGEEHYLSLIKFYDKPEDEYWGHLYRRDWIVKYGANPETGESFTGGYTDENDPDSWEDNVVFPSGGSDPIYLSDWEWMFEIFEKAQADLGITDSYCYTVPYNGFFAMGELTASFGGFCSGTFGRTLENKIDFGPVGDEFRTYLQVMNKWYQKGWLDPHFNERTNDMFYMIDTSSVFQGKVGMWFGLNSQVGGRIDNGDTFVKGICAYPAKTPINDLYGNEEQQFKQPYSAYRNSRDGGELLISTAAKNKDLSALLSFFDTLYAGEGSIIVSIGLNAEECAEMADDPVLKKYNLMEGAYTMREDENGNPIYVLSRQLQLDKDMRPVISASVMPGYVHVKDVDFGYTGVYAKAMDYWASVENIAYFDNTHLMSYLTTEEMKKYTNVKNKIGDYMNVHAPEMIMGKMDPYDDESWGTWTKTLTKYGYQKVIDIIQPYADQHPYAGYGQE